MTTITDIRNDLITVFNNLRDGKMEAKEAVEINNTAGKIISSAKVQLAYAALRGEKPDIAFLRSEVTPVALPPKEPGSIPAPLKAPFPSVTFQRSGKPSAEQVSDAKS